MYVEVDMVMRDEEGKLGSKQGEKKQEANRIPWVCETMYRNGNYTSKVRMFGH